MTRRLMATGEHRATVFGVYLLLTLLVWGLYALDRGPWQDEVMILYNVQRAGSLLAQLFTGIPTPTRILAGTVFAISHWTGFPVQVLQVTYGVAVFLTGCLVHQLGQELFPERPWLAYVSGALAVVATGDFSFNYLGALSLVISVSLHAAAVVCLVRWALRGGSAMLAASGALVALSLLTYEATLPAMLLAPLLAWALGRFEPNRRVLKAAVLWYVLIGAYLAFLTTEARRSGSYAAQALRPMSLDERWSRTWDLFSNNLTPWSWAFDRRNWYPPLPSLLPDAWKLALALVGVAVFVSAAVRLWRRGSEPQRLAGSDAYRMAVVAAGALVIALASNAAYASVQLSEFFFRTQLVSSLWASLAVAIASYVVGITGLRNLFAALMLPVAFVGFGVYGGLERQDYYLGYWRQHRQELRSVLEQVPGLHPNTRVLLYVPVASPYLATEATYLARCWVSYLYDDPSLYLRVFLWSPDRGTTCTAEVEGFRCLVKEGEPDAGWRTLPYDRTILLTFRPQENRYVLERSIPSPLLGPGPPPPAYHPQRQISVRPLTDRVRRLLYARDFLAAAWPVHAPSLALALGNSCLPVLDSLRWSTASISLSPASGGERSGGEIGLSGTVTGADPSLTVNLEDGPLLADEVDAAVIDISGMDVKGFPKALSGGLYFRRFGEGFDEAHTVKFSWMADGSPRRVRIDLGNQRSWHGPIAGFRLDPVDDNVTPVALPFEFTVRGVFFLRRERPVCPRLPQATGTAAR